MSRHHQTRMCCFFVVRFEDKTLMPTSTIDPPWNMGIYTNTSSKKALKDIVVHYRSFTHTFLLSLK